MYNKRFRLFASCILVKGFSESLIYDLERNTSYFIPNKLVSIIEDLQSYDYNYYLNKNKGESESIQSFVNQFIDEEIAFFTNNPESFLDLDLVWKSPSYISSSILQLNDKSTYNFQKLITDLCTLGCNALQIQVDSKLDILSITNYLESFNETSIRSIELFLSFNSEVSTDDLLSLLEKQPRLTIIKIFNSPFNNKVTKEEKYFSDKIIYSVKSKLAAQKIDKDKFEFNISLFSIAQRHNTALNRKVSITADGEIKNYLTSKKTFGNVESDDLKVIVKSKDFQKQWFISNDKIYKCKDCQFRYTCVNNSEVEFNNGVYYKTELCGYDPHNNVWK